MICGTPAPVTTRVVQIEPGPTPTLTASTPRAIRSRAPSNVATLPAISGTSGKRSLIRFAAAMTFSLWPCDESRQRRSTLAATSAAQRSSRSAPEPTAAATRSRPSASLQAFGYSCAFLMSLTVISPLRFPSSSTTRSFSMRCLCSSALAASRVVPTGAVTRWSLVMKSAIGRSTSVQKRRSRLVRIPLSWPCSSTTGRPEMRKRAIWSSASRTSRSGRMVTGSTIIPDSERFTMSTSSACRAIGMLRWITPRPPCCAMAMASGASVTVSMAAERIGMLRRIARVRREVTSTCAGCTAERPGISNTSSKVSASGRS